MSFLMTIRHPRRMIFYLAYDRHAASFAILSLIVSRILQTKDLDRSYIVGRRRKVNNKTAGKQVVTMFHSRSFFVYENIRKGRCCVSNICHLLEAVQQLPDLSVNLCGIVVFENDTVLVKDVICVNRSVIGLI